MSTVRIYGREGCHLCEVARAALLRLQAVEPFVLEEIDIERDPVLHARYLERIPVIALDGEELFDFSVHERALLARLRGSIVSER